MEHIGELEENWVWPHPRESLLIFECSHELLTQADSIKFSREKTCGEAEYVIVLDKGNIYIGIGSDHTDRELESVSVPKSKQICPKPIGRELWVYEEVKDHWDEIKVVSYQQVDGKEVPYQDGTLADILPVEKILEELKERVGDIEQSIIFSGTVPLLGDFVYGDRFKCMLVDEVLDRKLTLVYNVKIIDGGER